MWLLEMYKKWNEMKMKIFVNKGEGIVHVLNQ